MLHKVMPTRDSARQDDDEICDLDIILSRRVTFTYRGKVREILPITVERLFAFWDAGQEFKKRDHSDAEASNVAFHKIIETVCDDLTLEESSAMTVVQKANLLEHITRKVTGQAAVTDTLKKKLNSPE